MFIDVPQLQGILEEDIQPQGRVRIEIETGGGLKIFPPVPTI
jgi:hypothetical protein